MKWKWSDLNPLPLDDTSEPPARYSGFMKPEPVLDIVGRVRLAPDPSGWNAVPMYLRVSRLGNRYLIAQTAVGRPSSQFKLCLFERTPRGLVRREWSEEFDRLLETELDLLEQGRMMKKLQGEP